MFVRFFAHFRCKKGVEIIFVPVKMTPKLQKPTFFQHVQHKSFKNHRFFKVSWYRDASVSQSVPDRALGKLAEDLYRRKLLIKRDLESILDFLVKEVPDQSPQRTLQELWMTPAR